MKNNFSLYILLASFLFACQSSIPPQGEEESFGQEASLMANEAVLTRAQMDAIGLEVGDIERKSLSDLLKVTGELKVPNQNKAKVTSLYPGVIQHLYVQPGSFVKKGERIASIGNADFVKLQEEYLALQSQIALTEAELKRQRVLYEGKAGALKNLQRVEAEYQTQKNRISALRQQLSLMGIDINQLSGNSMVTSLMVTAPVSGVVSAILVQIGSYVDSTFPLGEIIDNRKLHMDLHVYEKDINRFSVGQKVNFYLTNMPDSIHTATVYSKGSTFEDDSKTIIVHAEVTSDKSTLIEGMNVSAFINLGQNEVDAVPVDAVQSHEGQNYIFIINPEKYDSTKGFQQQDQVSFLKVPVIVGKTDIGYTEVTPLTRVPEGAKVITKGAFFVLAKFTNQGEED